MKNKIKKLESTKDKTDIYNANVYKKLLKLGVNNSNDFRVAEAESIINDNGQKSDIMTKSEYKMTNSSISYDNYVKLTKKKNEALDKSIEKSWYAINHNINYNKSGVRTSFTDCISNNIAFLGIIAIILAHLPGWYTPYSDSATNSISLMPITESSSTIMPLSA